MRRGAATGCRSAPTQSVWLGSIVWLAAFSYNEKWPGGFSAGPRNVEGFGSSGGALGVGAREHPLVRRGDTLQLADLRRVRRSMQVAKSSPRCLISWRTNH